MGMLTGHKMCSSGYAEILFEAQLVTSGSVKGVLSGKAYTKSVQVLKGHLGKTAADVLHHPLPFHLVKTNNLQLFQLNLLAAPVPRREREGGPTEKAGEEPQVPQGLQTTG